MIVQVPVRLFYDFSSGHLQNRCVYQAVVVARRTIGKPGHQLPGIERNQYMVRVHKVEGHAYFVGQPLHLR